MVLLTSVELIVIAFILGTLLFTVAAVADIVRFPSETWKETGHIQWLWLGFVLVFPVLGSIVYLLAVRGDLTRASLSAAATMTS